MDASDGEQLCARFLIRGPGVGDPCPRVKVRTEENLASSKPQVTLEGRARHPSSPTALPRRLP